MYDEVYALSRFEWEETAIQIPNLRVFALLKEVDVVGEITRVPLCPYSLIWRMQKNPPIQTNLLPLWYFCLTVV